MDMHPAPYARPERPERGVLEAGSVDHSPWHCVDGALHNPIAQIEAAPDGRFEGPVTPNEHALDQDRHCQRE